MAFLVRRHLVDSCRPPSWHRLSVRFRRPFPALFLLLACLVFLGGMLYAPSNYDATTYRLPRVLSWLAEGHWFWIHTATVRMNDRSCGWEWIMAPVLLFTRSTRALFLINFIPFLLLPGLIFSMFTRLGIRGRVAAAWMWLVPTGYAFLLQAGGVGNDAFAAVYALAAIDFALRAAKSRSFADAALSCLAIALLGGAKTGNLPLMLPWLVVFLPAIPILLKRPVLLLPLGLVSCAASFLPMAVLNHLHCGDWTGFVLEPVLASRNPIAAIVGNSLMFLIGNFVPPLFPFTAVWNSSFLGWLPLGLGHFLAANFEPGFYRLGELPIEDGAGLGFSLSVLLVYSWLAAFRQGGPAQVVCVATVRQRRLFLLCVLVALLVFFAKSAMEALPRLLAAYYALLIPALLASPAQEILVRRRTWRYLAIGLTLLALPVLVLNPSRPLWPAKSFFARLDGDSHRLMRRAQDVYSVYERRSDTLAPLRAHLPADCGVVGFAALPNESPLSLFYPVGTRKVEFILDRDSPEEVRARGIQFAVISGAELERIGNSIEQWAKRYGADVVSSEEIKALIVQGPVVWHVVKFKAEGSGPERSQPHDQSPSIP